MPSDNHNSTSAATLAALKTALAEARAQIAASEKEHQDFRLQNDREWRAKLDHLKAELTEARAQIAAKDAEIKEMKDALRRSDGRYDSEARDEDGTGG